jgi:hypothetical protein
MTLRSYLPTFDKMMEALAENGQWWDSFNSKIHSNLYPSQESLLEYARKVYTTTSPTKLGTLVTAYARSSFGNDHLFEIVEQAIMSDITFLETVEGLNCLILLGKSYLDVGQPKRSWLLYRRGIAMAQILVR